MQSSTNPYPGNHMGKWQNTRKHHIQASQEVSSFQAGDHEVSKGAKIRNRNNQAITPAQGCNEQTKKHDKHET